MAKAKKLPSGSYRCRGFYTDSRGEVHKKSFTVSPDDYKGDVLARNRKAKAEAERLAEEWSLRRKEDDRFVTVEKAIDNYISGRANLISPSTLRSYRQIQRTYFADINETDTSELSSNDIQQLINKLSMTTSPKTVRNVIGILMSALEVAQPERRFVITYPKKVRTKKAIPTDNDLRRLIMNSEGDLRLGIILSAYGTLRRGEICALKYSDVLRDMGTIYIHADMIKDSDNKFVYKDMPKTEDSVRTVSFPKGVFNLIGEGEPDEFIISINPDTLTKRFCRLRDKLGVSCRFHDLRHMAASVMHSDLSIPEKYIEQRGGWRAGSNVLKGTYEHVTDTAGRKYDRMIMNYIDDQLKAVL